jgi:precorrin-6B methylase 2
MIKNYILFRTLIVLLLSLASNTLFPQEKNKNTNIPPVEGQAGKNVPWITTPQMLVDKMLDLAKITPNDFLIDLGSGDGRTVISAARRGTRALGVEYNPGLVKLSIENAEKEGVTKMTQFVEADIFEFDFSKATVISMFLLPEINMKLRPKLLDMKPGTRIVTNTFTMQDWHFDAVVRTGDQSNRWNTAYLWIVPAKVEGKWVLPKGGELTLVQQFQMFTGKIKAGGKDLPITEGRLRGNEITFKAGGDIYSGTVAGRKIEGAIISGAKTGKWSASR